MKQFRHVVVALMVVFAFVLPGNGCGPFSTIAVFVRSTRPDGAYAEYVKGSLGIPQVSYRLRHLVVAYDWWNGHGLTPGEQAQAVALDRFVNGLPGQEGKPGSGMTAWIAATGGEPKGTDRSVPNDDYETFANCLDDAFQVAAQTLAARKSAHGNDAVSVTAWVQGQQAVFANCDGSAKVMPEAVAANAPLWLQKDRAYQLGAAKFYQADYDGAIAQMRTVAADKGSPWQATARLVMARAMIRRATVGNVDPVTPVVVRTPGTFPQTNYQEMQKKQEALKAARPKRLVEAGDELRGILADPAMKSLQPSAQRLLDFVNLRLDPAAQTKVLAGRIAGPDRPQDAGRFAQGLTDLRYIAMSSPNQALPPATGASFGVTDWVALMEAGITPRNAAQAVAGWRSTQATAWLMVALMMARPGDAAVPELLKAAADLPQSSPAWLTVTYQRMRLKLGEPGTRAELENLPPVPAKSGSRSTVNLFRELKQRSSPTLGAFLDTAGSLPAVIYVDDSTEDDDAFEKESATPSLCGPPSVSSAVMLFSEEAATLLNTRMPLTMLAEAAGSQALPANLRFQVAQAAWTRAVLLRRPEIAKRLTPLLVGCYPSWKPWLEKYDSAISAEDREANGLLAMMRFASTEPVVRNGEQRDEGFATYSAYRDNWWQGSLAATPAVPGGGGNTLAVAANLFGSAIVAQNRMPDPPFLKAEDRTEAAREVGELSRVPCASDYFAQAALEWQKSHPADARTPDILGFAERVVRNGCRTDSTKELNHSLFTVVQTKYPKSEWARKYTTWE